MTLAYIYSSDSICWLKYITHWGIIYEQHFPVILDTVTGTHIFRYHEYIFESKEHSTYNGCRNIHHHWKNPLIYKSNVRFSCFFSSSNNSSITRGILDKPRGNTIKLSKNLEDGPAHNSTMKKWNFRKNSSNFYINSSKINKVQRTSKQ